MIEQVEEVKVGEDCIIDFVDEDGNLLEDIKPLRLSPEEYVRHMAIAKDNEITFTEHMQQLVTNALLEYIDKKEAEDA